MVADNYAALLARQRAEVTDGLFSAVRRLRWSADRLAAERERRLLELLSWSVERSTFHAERLGDIDANRFTEADLPSLPIMTKADLMDNFDEAITDPALTLDLVNTHVDKLDDDDYLLNQYRVIATSGSTGARGLFVYGWEDWTTFVLIATRWGQGADSLPFNASVGTLFASNTRHVSGALHAFFRDLTGNGATPVTHLPVTLPLPQIVAGLNAAQPVVLQGYPSAMHLLAIEAKAGRLKISPRRVSTCGEQCTGEARAAVADAWGVEIYDIWGCSEGVYAFPCNAGNAMHLPDDLAPRPPRVTGGQSWPPRRQNRTPAGRAVPGTATANMAAFNPSFATAYEAPTCLLAHRSTSRMSARQRTSSRQAAQADATASGSATAPLNAASRSSSRWNRDGTSWPSRTRRSGRFRERRASPSRVTSGAAAIDEKDARVRVADATAGPHATAPPRGGFGGADIWGHDHSVAPRTGV